MPNSLDRFKYQPGMGWHMALDEYAWDFSERFDIDEINNFQCIGIENLLESLNQDINGDKIMTIYTKKL